MNVPGSYVFAPIQVICMYYYILTGTPNIGSKLYLSGGAFLSKPNDINEPFLFGYKLYSKRQ